MLYTRFWHKFLYDIGVVPTTAEPYAKRTSHGMILGENGEKMSKTRGNVVNPTTSSTAGRGCVPSVRDVHGRVRSGHSVVHQRRSGCRRFLDRVWRLMDMIKPGEGYSKELTPLMHETIKKVGDDYEAMKYNTAIAAMMSLVNEFYAKNGFWHCRAKSSFRLTAVSR